MPDQPTIRPGQRIRVTAVHEGAITAVDSEVGCYTLRCDADGVALYGSLRPSTCVTIEVLAEPRIPEPTTRTAVVLRPRRRGGLRPHRIRLGLPVGSRRLRDPLRMWSVIADPILLHPGWTESEASQ